MALDEGIYGYYLQAMLSDKDILTGVVDATDPRGISSVTLTATSEQQNAPTITMREVPNSTKIICWRCRLHKLTRIWCVIHINSKRA